MQRDIVIALQLASQPKRDAYLTIVKELDALSDKWRGTGTKTAILSLALSWIYRDKPIEQALLTSARLIGSDTDTIATLAGAILGAVRAEPLQHPLMDAEYIAHQADHMFRLSQAERVDWFDYPDLMRWQPPKYSLEAAGLVNDQPALAGLGFLQFVGEPMESKSKDAGVRQWALLEFGQRILCKRRQHLKPLDPSSLPVKNPNKSLTASIQRAEATPKRTKEGNLHLFERAANAPEPTLELAQQSMLDRLTSEAIKSGFDPVVIGNHMRQLMAAGSIEASIGYAAILGKAWSARQRRNGV
jgi:hypothetical protein